MRGAWGKAGNVVFPLAEVLTLQGWDAIPAHTSGDLVDLAGEGDSSDNDHRR